jgi:hypothetical protein
MARKRWGTIPDRLALLAALFALILSGLSYCSTERRLNTQEEERFAIYVDLGEVPSDVYDSQGFRDELGSKAKGEVWQAVINPSPVAIRDVWVEGRDGEIVEIGEIQRCTLYVLHDPDVDEPNADERDADPVGFEPRFVYFKDPEETWRLSADGVLKKRYKTGDEESRDVNDGDAEDLPMENCV